MLINTIQDLVSYELTPEKEAFLLAIYNDFITFDDAKYPEDYDRDLGPDDEGYVAPVLRKEWNAGAAASWGFGGREQIEALLNK
jgi:hypothetical protein